MSEDRQSPHCPTVRINPLPDRPRRAVSRPFEERDQFPFDIRRPDLVNAGLVAAIYFLCFDIKQIARSGRTCEADRDLQRDGQLSVGITGKREGRIGGGEQDAAMYDVETVDHPVIDRVMQPAVPRSDLVDLKTKPLRKTVLFQ